MDIPSLTHCCRLISKEHSRDTDPPFIMHRTLRACVIKTASSEQREPAWNETNINIVYRSYLTQCIFYCSLVPRDHFGDVEIVHVQISIHRGSLWIGLIATVQVRIGLYTRGLNRCIHIRGWLSIIILLFLAITLACKRWLIITTTIWYLNRKSQVLQAMK